MRFKEEATIKRLPNEADGHKFIRNAEINDDNEFILPMIRLLNAMLMNGYQS